MGQLLGYWPVLRQLSLVLDCIEVSYLLAGSQSSHKGTLSVDGFQIFFDGVYEQERSYLAVLLTSFSFISS